MSIVHTWAMFFLRNLKNMSCMVPCWASTGSTSVPIWGARVRSNTVRRRLFIVLMTAAHISPNVFSLRKFLRNIQGLFHTVHSNIHLLYITFIRTFTSFILYVLFTYSLLRIFMAGWLPLGFLCPIQSYSSRTEKNSKNILEKVTFYILSGFFLNWGFVS